MLKKGNKDFIKHIHAALSTLKIPPKWGSCPQKKLAKIINLLFKKLHVTTNTHLAHFCRRLTNSVAHDRSLAKNSRVNVLGYSTFAKVLKHLGIVTSHSSVVTGEFSNPKHLKKAKERIS